MLRPHLKFFWDIIRKNNHFIVFLNATNNCYSIIRFKYLYRKAF
jgi:hypothetical protein